MNRSSALAAALAALALASSAKAAPPPAEHFFRLPAFHDATLSPSGKRMALTATAANGRVGLFVIDLQGTEFKPVRAALLGSGDVSTFDWVDDERLVFTETDLSVGLAESRRRAPGLYAVRHDGEEPTYLVEVEGRAVVTDGSRSRSLPWNHQLLHVPVPSEDRAGARADEVIVGELSFSDRELHEVRPLWLNTRNGRTREFVVVQPPCRPLRWWFSAQGQPRLIHCVAQGRSSMHWLDRPRDGQPARWTSIGESPRGWLPFEPLWVGQDDTLFVEAHRGSSGESVVARFDFATRAPGKVLVQAPGFDVDATLIGDRDGQRLLGVRLSTDAEQTVWFDTAIKTAQQRADEALPGRVNRIECRRCGGDDAVMLVRSFSDRDPGQLLLWRQADNGGKGRWLRMGPLRRDIVPEQMAATDLHRIQARDGRDLPVWVTRPGGPRQPAPAVVLVHGGPWVRGRHWDWQPMPQFLASRGYVVIEPEFRGSAGYGMAHLKAGFRHWGQAMQDDVADALLWARRQGLAGEAACIVGASYGGYSALMGLVRHPELYRCASAQVAVTDLLLLLEGSWWVHDDVSAAARSYGLPEKLGDPQKDREMLLANSPVTQAARITRPLQLVWGLEDRRVPITHGRRLRDAMQKAGAQPEWIVYDDEAHGLGKVEHQVDFAKKLEAFLGRHLRDDAAPR